ncbi:L,D-transpeptidase [Acidimangrovimonas sediminis]|uniref:L,D-transpeptidase n=1 Tax=Acidimangrovimonas sediminis TaxID=2056283 RepID=UPI000C8008DE|nr:L,D-transpeptidase [Acidimangrovimonas sediminis]
MTGRRKFGRRGLLGMVATGFAALATPYKAGAVTGPVHWQDHFDSLANGAILADTRGGALHFWTAEGAVHRLYPIAADGGGALRRGVAQVVRKVEGPTWRPSAGAGGATAGGPGGSVAGRAGIVPPGPDNPLGSHALYLDWQGVRIHGRGESAQLPQVGTGISLSNAHIAELFPLARIGMPVKVL